MPAVKQRLRRAWAADDHARALEQLRALASELDRSYPGAAGSLREGLEETLTLTRLGVTGNLKRTLESTNPYALTPGPPPEKPTARGTSSGRPSPWRDRFLACAEICRDLQLPPPSGSR